jgi:structure-specific endonuclease subunit SLX1
MAGAKRTAKHRPWKYLVIISGFPNKVIALQFEWQFQHPLESRIVRKEMKIHQKWSKGWRGKLEILALLTEIKLWSQLRLSLNFLDENAYRWFRSQFPSNPTKISLLGSVREILIPIPPVASEATQRCFQCSKSGGLKWICSSCETVSHLFCTALQSETPSLIPSAACCPQCRVGFSWGEIVRLTVTSQQASSDDQMNCESSSSEESEASEEEEEDGEERQENGEAVHEIDLS